MAKYQGPAKRIRLSRKPSPDFWVALALVVAFIVWVLDVFVWRT
jgi:hypothetical protein